MWIINNRKIFYGFSILLMVLSLFSIFYYGLKLGIDFTGGSVLEVRYSNERPAQENVNQKLVDLGLSGFVLRSSGDTDFIIKAGTIGDTQKEQILNSLREGDNQVEISKFSTIGPTLGNELKNKAIVALIVVLFVTVLFIAFAFRKVSKPVSSWKYGFVTVIALAHDIIITIGFFALLGGLYGTEIDTLFVTALLVILGYSINDTIVILDRVRENLADKNDNDRKANFSKYVGKSLIETFARSINTSLTTLLSLTALYIFGGDSTSNFALVLIVGMVAGVYSSVFIAAPLLVSFKDFKEKRK